MNNVEQLKKRATCRGRPRVGGKSESVRGLFSFEQQVFDSPFLGPEADGWAGVVTAKNRVNNSAGAVSGSKGNGYLTGRFGGTKCAIRTAGGNTTITSHALSHRVNQHGAHRHGAVVIERPIGRGKFAVTMLRKAIVGLVIRHSVGTGGAQPLL